MSESGKPPSKVTPVEVTNQAPLPVEVQNDEPLRVRTEQDKVAATRVTRTDAVLASAKVDADAARAAAAVDAAKLQTEDQRRVSGVWESTQQIVAISVVESALIVISAVILTPSITVLLGNEPAQFAITAAIAGMLFLTGVANLVIGFYFGRTNHTRVGGSTGQGPNER